MKRYIALTLICLSFAIGRGSAQSDTALFPENVKVAERLMDEGLYDESIELLDATDKLDPTRTALYSYEKALVYYLKGDYKTAIKLLRKSILFRDASDSVYQLLGNCYEMTGKPKKAISVYVAGIERFLYSSRLYNELGKFYESRSDRDLALGRFIAGIELDPSYAPNYFDAANIYLASENKAFGMVNGETAICLEPGSPRSGAMSEALLATYRENISFPGDTTVRATFSSGNIPLKEQIALMTGVSIPFPLLYELLLEEAVDEERTIDIPSLIRIRRRFIQLWFSAEVFPQTYYCPLFDYHRTILEAGHWEAYNRWLFSFGDRAAFDLWNILNESKTAAFFEWFGQNSIIRVEQ